MARGLIPAAVKWSDARDSFYNRSVDDREAHAPFRAVSHLRCSLELKMASPIRLSDDDVAFLLTLLRNANQPMTTRQLGEALRRQSGQAERAETEGERR